MIWSMNADSSMVSRPHARLARPMFLARPRSTFSKNVASWSASAYSAYMLRSVLKRREDRLKREQAGLRSLISGLVGGPALLREWEREWLSRFGGPERDEATLDVSEDDGPDDGESEEDDANLHPKKRIKSAPKKPAKDVKPKKEETSPGVVPEKRKRGRPRKVQPVPEGATTQQQVPLQGLVSSVPAPTQYLLAVFAFFSFFNSPFSSYSHATPTHSGVVLADSGTFNTQPVSIPTFGWRELLQAFHLVISGLVFFTILLPFLPKGFPRTLSLSSFPRTDAARRAALINALDSAQHGTSNEAACLLTALGVYPGFVGLLLSFATPTRGGKAKTLEHRQLEQRAWVRLAELAVFDRMSRL